MLNEENEEYSNQYRKHTRHTLVKLSKSISRCKKLMQQILKSFIIDLI